MWWLFLNIRSGSWSVKIHAGGGGRFSQAGQARRVAPLLAPTTSTQVHPLQLCCKGEREKKSRQGWDDRQGPWISRPYDLRMINSRLSVILEAITSKKKNAWMAAQLWTADFNPRGIPSFIVTCVTFILIIVPFPDRTLLNLVPERDHCTCHVTVNAVACCKLAKIPAQSVASFSASTVKHYKWWVQRNKERKV